MDIFIQQVLNGLVLGSVYAIIALGYTMVYGILGIINFAHGDVLMVGAMVALSAIGVLQNHFPQRPVCRDGVYCRCRFAQKIWVCYRLFLTDRTACSQPFTLSFKRV
jgi:branched-subunit amino acid ABC-type transport system permease component